MKAAVKPATSISRSPDWRESGAYGDGLMPLADMQRQRLFGPHAAQVDERAAFAGELEQIRAAYRAKRDFIKLLAAAVM